MRLARPALSARRPAPVWSAVRRKMEQSFEEEPAVQMTEVVQGVYQRGEVQAREQRVPCKVDYVPQRGIVRCSLGITLSSGEEVRPFSPIVFETGRGMVFPGLEAAAVHLKPGQYASFVVLASQGYSDREDVPGVPEFSELHVDLEIHHVTELSAKKYEREETTE